MTMRRFIKEILCFIVLLLFVGAIIEIALLFRPNIYSYKREMIENNLDNIEVLLLGNSHIQEGIVPSVIGRNTYNFAMDGRDLDTEVFLAQRYIPQMTKLRIVIMPLDYDMFILGRYKRNPVEVRDVKGEASFIKTNKCMFTKYMGVDIYGLWYWSEFLNSDDKFLDRFWKSKDDIIDCDSLGFFKLRLNRRRKDWKSYNVAAYVDIHKERDEIAYDKVKSQYSQLAELASGQKAHLILLDVPMYASYRSSINPYILEERREFVQELMSKYTNVSFYEFMSSPDFNDDDFADASHLSEYGAVKFSKMLKPIVEKINCSRQDSLSVSQHTIIQ